VEVDEFMRLSKAFIHTLYEAPKDAEVISHILLLRGGYIYPVAAGIYALLPLGHRVVQNISRVVREEMNRIDGVELTMPVLNPAELWKETGRYFDIGEELIRLKDRKQREFVLAMTHEEVVTDIARKFIRSYRDLPFMLYQIQTKIRDEARPRAGVIRLREFLMKDAYSFHRDFDDLDEYYPKVYDAYRKIFERCGLRTAAIEADSGIMGGSGSHEFMLESPNGEDQFVLCSHCGYQANTEKAVGVKPRIQELKDPKSAPPLEKVHTPNIKTISDLMEFFGISRDQFVKSVAYLADGKLVLAAIRGDFEISETKLRNHLKAIKMEMAPEEVLLDKGYHPGFLSPIGMNDPDISVVIDSSLGDGGLMVAGANEEDYHYKNVVPGRDFDNSTTVDIAEVRKGDVCAQCGQGKLEIRRGIELGHTFKLGTKYTDENSMNVTYLDDHGKERRVVMGCYGIGIERLMAAVVEKWHDENGIIWPVSIAPYDIYLIVIGKGEEEKNLGEKMYDTLSSDFEILWDDRSESPGVKFKDADLIGIPFRVVISTKLLKENAVEVKVRETGEVFKSAPEEVSGKLIELKEKMRTSLR